VPTTPSLTHSKVFLFCIDVHMHIGV
jgi:hypothetical protein